MKIEKGMDSEHQIQNLTRTPSAMEYSFGWKFQNASHFLIAIMAGMGELELDEDIIPVLEAQGDELVHSKSVEERGLQLHLLEEKKFRLNRNRYAVSRQKLKPQTPYQVAVYACEMTEDCLKIYESRGKENRNSIQVVLIGRVKYKNPLFSRQTVCRLTVPKIPDYTDGMIVYKPSCSRCVFPMSESCLGRDVVVTLPKGETVSLLVSENCRQFYTIKVEEG